MGGVKARPKPSAGGRMIFFCAKLDHSSKMITSLSMVPVSSMPLDSERLSSTTESWSSIESVIHSRGDIVGVLNSPLSIDWTEPISCLSLSLIQYIFKELRIREPFAMVSSGIMILDSRRSELFYDKLLLANGLMGQGVGLASKNIEIKPVIAGVF